MKLPVLLALFLATFTARAEVRVRQFTFTYSATVTSLAPHSVAKIWIPVPSDMPEQQVSIVRQDLPAEAHVGVEPKYRNAYIYFEARADDLGKVPLKIVYHVRRSEVCGEAGDPTTTEELAKFLKADSKVPVGGKPSALLVGQLLPDDQRDLARKLYDLVDDRMAYRKDQPGWGTGDAEWACDSRFGNCTDFHSLFISLARSAHIPAKFEIGFGLPELRGSGAVPGYHCWAKFKPQGHGWIPVDISEANRHPEKRDYFFSHLCENRVAFTTGRDLTLGPDQKGPPINFFVYPYVEVDGKPYPQEKIIKAFSYADDAEK